MRLGMAHGIIILAVVSTSVLCTLHIRLYISLQLGSIPLNSLNAQGITKLRGHLRGHPSLRHFYKGEQKNTGLDVRISPRLNPFTPCSGDNKFIEYWGGASHHKSRECHSVETRNSRIVLFSANAAKS